MEWNKKKHNPIPLVVGVLLLMGILLGGLYFYHVRKVNQAKATVLSQVESLSRSLKNQDFGKKGVSSKDVGELVQTKLEGYHGDRWVSSINTAMGLTDDTMSDGERQSAVTFGKAAKSKLITSYKVDQDSIKVDEGKATVKVTYQGIGSWMDLDISEDVAKVNASLTQYITDNGTALMDASDANGHNALRASLMDSAVQRLYQTLTESINGMDETSIQMTYTYEADSKGNWMCTEVKMKEGIGHGKEEKK